MKKSVCIALVSLALPSVADFEVDRTAMSDKYWEVWNDDVQAKIDADIEKYRKADASVEVDAPDGTEVKVEQVSHAFFFGAHIFNYNQLGKKEWNERYKELYGTLFNSATVAFYWKSLEPYQGKVRFEERYEDTEEFWNTCVHRKDQPHWRRPAVDPVINFCRSRGLRIHGHPLCWGNNAWMTPSWIWDEFCPKSEKDALEAATGIRPPGHDWRLPLGVREFGRDEGTSKGPRAWPDCWRRIFEKLSPDEVAAICPTYFANLNKFTFERIKEIAAKYGTRVDSWDVCNESADDFHGKSVTGKPFQKSFRYGVTAGDLCYNAFKTAQECLPKSAWLNINDYAVGDNYAAQIADLEKNGCRVDVVGAQMHLFNPATSADIARGEYEGEVYGKTHPDGIAKRFATLAKTGKPIHLSEITITAPDMSPRGQMVQAIITRDLYRAWFSIEKMTGITWWNVVDDCGAPGEPSISGLFKSNMTPKTVYFALDDLINREWTTKTSVSAAGGKVAFRGFRGRYRLSWKDAEGNSISKLVEVR